MRNESSVRTKLRTQTATSQVFSRASLDVRPREVIRNRRQGAGLATGADRIAVVRDRQQFAGEAQAQ